MKHIAVFEDDLLMNFRLDDDGRTLVMTDKLGATRAVPLMPISRPIITNTDGYSLYMTEGHIKVMQDYEQEQITQEYTQKIRDDILRGEWGIKT